MIYRCLKIGCYISIRSLLNFGKLNLYYASFVGHLKKQLFICLSDVHFYQIFGEKLKYSFQIILLF